jgi:hypothetical protein
MECKKKMIMWGWKEGIVWYSENFADKEWCNGALFRNMLLQHYVISYVCSMHDKVFI